MNNEGYEVMVLSKKVKVIWLTGGKRKEQVFDTRQEAEPLMKELNEKGELWVLTDKV
ncbi:hypothetical protein GZH47_32685 (plasmid) [Paenibacillus rhizovicinus]|uniref:Uncharacterized protein n=1 Tax=Paenibacillus rhizovicinus TaxID=2704463 RepID=A0A6C0PAU5_9BACL|nr:hypothetical protein [Paenibacillus rhizovicinus]QHW35657.1 hypothetical protein GZH47_32685 [Paenibacillus rhizovicinus]